VGDWILFWEAGYYSGKLVIILGGYLIFWEAVYYSGRLFFILRLRRLNTL